MPDTDDDTQPETALARQARALERIAALLRVVAVAAAITLLVATLGEMVMLVFAAVLVAVLLRGAADWTGRVTGIGTGWGLLVVVVLLIAFFGGLGWGFGPSLGHQAAQLHDAVLQQLAALRDRMADTDWGRSLLRDLPFGLGRHGNAPVPPSSSATGIGSVIPRLASFVAGALWSVIGVLGTVGVILAAALYMAAAPAPYVHGLAHLMPKKQRPEAHRVLDRVGHALRGWLMGQFFDMLIVGALCGAGLWLLGVPLVFILALIAALTNFVPYIGAISGAVPAVLIAFSESGQKAFYVALLYLAVQTFEGNVTGPLIQRRAIDLPPALTILAQTAFGLVFGLFGVILATPFTAAIIAAVQEFTEEDPNY